MVEQILKPTRALLIDDFLDDPKFSENGFSVA
jgi:hypothetical protein